jgi:hypothetical protein
MNASNCHVHWQALFNQITLSEPHVQRSRDWVGEVKQRELVSGQQLLEALRLETAGGGLKVHWDGNAQATALGQMAFFIEFLTVTGLFDQWVADGSAELEESPRIERVRYTGDVAAFDFGGSLALCARERDPRRWR